MEHELTKKSKQKKQAEKTASSSLRSKPAESTRTHPVLQLQRAIGNQAVQRLLNSGKVQAKLTIGQPGDAYEQEADQMAQQVVSSPPPHTIQRFSTTNNTSDKEPSAPPIVNEVLGSGGGRSLDGPVRASMEDHFGQDFSQVRVHTDGRSADSAQSINAMAYTVGSDIVFGSGQYAPETTHGKRLLAHELTHVVQQSKQSAQLNRATDSTGVVVQREDIEVSVIETPKSDLSVTDLVDNNIEIQLEMLASYQAALTSFFEVINSSSAKEALPKKAGQIALEKATKFVFKYMIDEAFKHMPGGEYIKKPIELGQEILEALEKEEARAGAASTSNAVVNFVVSERDKAADMHLNLGSNHILIRNEVMKNYQKMSKPEQENLRKALVSDNSFYLKQKDQSQQAQLFKLLVESWIGAVAPTKEGAAPSYVFIRLDKDWKVTTAHIHSPGGQRLAEQLLRQGNGKVNLNEFKVPRTVEFNPYPLTWVIGQFNAEGQQVGNITANIFGKLYVDAFIGNMTKIGLPETTVMTGDMEKTE
jgi:hypothetical protein